MNGVKIGFATGVSRRIGNKFIDAKKQRHYCARLILFNSSREQRYSVATFFPACSGLNLVYRLEDKVIQIPTEVLEAFEKVALCRAEGSTDSIAHLPRHRSM